MPPLPLSASATAEMKDATFADRMPAKDGVYGDASCAVEDMVQLSEWSCIGGSAASLAGGRARCVSCCD